ncbi:MAG: hypothetical protein KDD47_16000, partial [Acidobacteria bacterium]|nr:hypothetical protein [Acidobacteriota bacterium]
TSEENQNRIEDLRRAHLERLDRPEAPAPGTSLPAIVWLGYSIHGDEASGSNASMLVAYHLAAAHDPSVEKLLEETIILLDPSLNPDGLGRFAQWANSHRGVLPASAVDHREHQQVWPGGRTNHYWFDLNRDWLLLQHPESQARMETFQAWRPHLLGDFHEMGSDATYFFQPGVPQRTNPLIPEENLELTRRVAAFHSGTFDRHGVAYFTEEQYDDFYPGKGSTYPDLGGTVGVLFEQASARGHRRDTSYGPLTFPQAIYHHVLTSLSMVEAVHEMRADFQAYQEGFAAQALAAAETDPMGGWVFHFPGDPGGAAPLMEALLRHRLEVRPLTEDLSVEGKLFPGGASYLVPARQPRYRLAKALFEIRTSFADSTFYDISAWNFGYAFGARWASVARKELPEAGPALETAPAYQGSLRGAGSYAYAVRSGPYNLHRLLERVLAAGYPSRLATKAFEAEADDELISFEAGSLIFPASPGYDGDQLKALLRRTAAEEGIDVFALATGRTPAGVDLGSSTFKPVMRPRPLLVVGEGVSAYDAGTVWNLLDRRFRLELPLVEAERLGRMDLRSFTHLILVDGTYQDLEGKSAAGLRQWIRQGGTVIAAKRAAEWAAAHLLSDPEAAKAETPASGSGPQAKEDGETDSPDLPRRTYGDFEEERQAQRISGAIFAAEADRTHPLAFGFPSDRIALFRDSAQVLEGSVNPYENVIAYTDTPLLAGYSSPKNLEKIAGSAAAVVTRVGRGVVVRLGCNPSFRGFWYGTDRLYLNALYFSSAIQETPPPERWGESARPGLVD